MTNQIVRSGISNHISSGSSLVPKNRNVGIDFAYVHILSGPVAKASKITVMTTPTRIKILIWLRLGCEFIDVQPSKRK